MHRSLYHNSFLVRECQCQIFVLILSYSTVVIYYCIYIPFHLNQIGSSRWTHAGKFQETVQCSYTIQSSGQRQSRGITHTPKRHLLRTRAISDCSFWWPSVLKSGRSLTNERRCTFAPDWRFLWERLAFVMQQQRADAVPVYQESLYHYTRCSAKWPQCESQNPYGFKMFETTSTWIWGWLCKKTYFHGVGMKCITWTPKMKITWCNFNHRWSDVKWQFKHYQLTLQAKL